MLEQLTRRKLIGGLGLLIAAPAVIRVAKLMPVRPIEPPLYMVETEGFDIFEVNIRPGAITWVQVPSITWPRLYVEGVFRENAADDGLILETLRGTA